jgi:hypothetical protein
VHSPGNHIFVRITHIEVCLPSCMESPLAKILQNVKILEGLNSYLAYAVP